MSDPKLYMPLGKASLKEAEELLPLIKELRAKARHWVAMKLDVELIRPIEWSMGCVCGRTLPEGVTSQLCEMHPARRTTRLPPRRKWLE